MKIVALSGSPRPEGNTHILLKAFAAGAAQAGHEMQHFDAATMKIGPCRACDFCRRSESWGQCCQNDDMQEIYRALAQANCLVLATPLYYFSFSAQLKLAIDRLYSCQNLQREEEGAGGLKKIVLLAVCGDDNKQTFSGLLESYRHIYSYLGLENVGQVLAEDVYLPGDIMRHPALEQATQLALDL